MPVRIRPQGQITNHIMDKTLIKEGPQLTGAEALDFILETLRRRIAHPWETLSEQYNDGMIAAYDMMREIVEVLRAEKFAEPQTKDPFKVVQDSRSFSL